VVATVGGESVVTGAEEEFPVRDHAFQDTDGVDDGSDGHPGNFAVLACGDVVAVLIGDVLVVPAADQMPPGGAIGCGLRIRAAA
jgi:hypothetical protein